MSKKANLYVGRAGQMAVISEFLIRGWNVAVPEVDIGIELCSKKNPCQRNYFWQGFFYRHSASIRPYLTTSIRP